MDARTYELTNTWTDRHVGRNSYLDLGTHEKNFTLPIHDINFFQQVRQTLGRTHLNWKFLIFKIPLLYVKSLSIF